MEEPGTDQRITLAWHENHAYLVDLAFRMLGDIGAAEDVAQEAFTRLAVTKTADVESPRGWLTVVTSRLCLDQLRSARSRRERTDDAAVQEATTPLTGPPLADPADRITLDDEVQSALHIVLQRLSPAERVAFILHDVFATPFDTIAVTLGKPSGTCRQLARRARQKIATIDVRPGEIASPEHRMVVDTFIGACSTGDLDALVKVLDPDVWGVAEFDGHRKVNHDVEVVARTLLQFFGSDTTLVSLPSSGHASLLAYRRQARYATIALTIENARVRKVHVTIAPD